MQPIKLYESLFILYKCSESIRDQSDHLKQISESNKSFTRVDHVSTNHIILETCSFLNEFKNNFYRLSEHEYQTRIQCAIKISSPILARIKSWKDLGTYRNNIIAHPWRDGNKFVFPHSTKYNVPRSFFEHILLAQLIAYVFNVVTVEFKSEIDEALIYMLSLVPKNEVQNSYKNLQSDHISMAYEVENEAKKYSKHYEMKILAFEFPSNTLLAEK